MNDYDPDLNFYNNLTNNCYARCNYYLEDGFIHEKNVNSLDSALSFFHMNVRSLLLKKSDLEAYFKTIQHQLKTVGITETWLCEEKLNDAHFDHYNAVHNYQKKTVGGGTSIFVHKSLNFSEHTDFNRMENLIECNFIEIDTKYPC
jgi:hypothetical protein